MSDHPIYEQRNRGNLEIKQKNIMNTHNPQKYSCSKGIIINADIQNRINYKQNQTTLNSEYEPTPKIDRTAGLMNIDRKSKKTGRQRGDHVDFDLECTEELFPSKKNIKSEAIIKEKYTELSFIE